MVLQSGSPPYNYAVANPLRVRNPYTNIGVQGPSGIFLEQGQFIITAETRKFSSSAHELSDFNIYVHPLITPSGPYEPKANGSTLSSPINPANLFIINHILETRDALDNMFSYYESESESSFDEFKIDWLKQIAPELALPSGYRRHDPGTTDYPFVETVDINTLGGSGVLFDLDFTEVMFNPYPWFANNNFLDVHTLGSFRIANAPVWPCFQKTNGNIVSLNGREPTTGLSSEYDVTHFSANEVRLDGYVFLPQTDYLIGKGLHNFIPEGSFTYVSSSPRTVNNGNIVPTTRVFATTQSLNSGIYKIVARNRKSVIPITTVESGIVSQWPVSGQAYPATNGHIFDVIPGFNNRSVWYDNQEFEHGYQVFDDAFWIIDHADGDRAPSGLAIASPFTGHAMWLRFAELTRSSGSGVFGGSVDSSRSWGGHVGLERVGSIIYRVQREQTDGSNSATHTALIQKYNGSLDYIGEIETPESNSVPQSYDDMAFLSNRNEWVFYDTSVAGTLGVEFFSSDFSSFIDRKGAFYIGALQISAATAVGDAAANIFGITELEGIVRSPGDFSDGNGTSFHTRGSGIWDLDIDTPGSGIIFKNCRLIDMSKITGQWSSTLGAKIYDMITVPETATHIIPGSYVLISWGTGSSNRLFLLRIKSRDDATAPGFCVGFWDVLAAYDLGSMPSDALVTVNNIPNMIWKDID